MSRTREPEVKAGEVPPELLSIADPTWSDQELFAGWLQRHDLGESKAEGWYYAFCAGRDRWARVNGFEVVSGRHGSRQIDQQRLKDAGVPWCGAVHRGAAMAGNPAALTYVAEYPAQLPRTWLGD